MTPLLTPIDGRGANWIDFVAVGVFAHPGV